jgi:hypothetical protein
VLPYIETVETPWGTKLIPADELERVLAKWRRPARPRRKPERAGRPPTVAGDVVERIREARAAGLSLRQIADRLNTGGDADRPRREALVGVHRSLRPGLLIPHAAARSASERP